MNLAVVGLGKLGSALAAVLSAQHDVVGYDVNPVPVDAINAGRAPTDEPDLDKYVAWTHGRSLRATTDVADLASAEVVFIVVPTPSDTDGRFDNRYVLDAIRTLGPVLAPRCTVAVVSTVMPGSCAGPIHAALVQATGHPVGRDPGCRLVFSPAFIALGSVIHDLTHPDVILIGCDDDHGVDVVEPILAGMRDIDEDSRAPRVHRMSLVEAELAKLSLNVSIGVKVAFAHEVAMVAEQIGADAAKVLAAVGNDSRIGPGLLRPGPTAGGPCLGRDGVAFCAVASDVRVSAFLTHGADQVHRAEPRRVLDRLLSMAHGEDPVIGILGAAYKVGSAVTEASIGVRVAEMAVRQSRLVFLHDPKARPDIAGVYQRDSGQDVVDAADVILVATAWPEYRDLNYGGKPVFDLWGEVPATPGVHRFGNGAT